MTALMSGCTSSPKNENTNNSTDTAIEEVTEQAGENTAEPAADIFINSDWTAGQVAIGGGGFVTGIISTCEKGVFYTRTDVGGAYRWDDTAKKWVSLCCFVTADDVGLLGIDGIAADPHNASKVVMAAGTDYFSGGKTCILVSEDYGETFAQVDVTSMIKVHGNGNGRGNGERIAIDPNDGNIIFCGGRTGGLIRSTDGGDSWEKVDFPVSATSNGNGINIILFDPSSGSDGKASQRIFAAVSEKDTDNIFVSDDAGSSWAPLAGAITEYMPQRMRLSPSGKLYVTYADSEGPWNASAGALLRYDIDAGTYEDISPVQSAWGDIVSDPADESRLVCVTTEKWEGQPNGAFGDQFFVSTDGGASWTNVMSSARITDNGMSWINGYAIHWCSSLMIDPFDGNKIMVNSGNGIFACDNIWDKNPEFYFDAQGIEEVVPLDILSYPDHALLTGIYDYDGFDHDDIMTSPPRHTMTIGAVTGLAMAAQNYNVRVEVGGDENNQKLIYSEDDGKTWKNITISPDKSKKLYQGYVALTADGNNIIWSPSNARVLYYTEDRGKTWEQCSGIAGNSAYVVGDTVDPDYVYACTGDNIYVSSDGGKTFSNKFDKMGSYKRIVPVFGEAGKFYAAGAGLFFTEDHGDNFTRIDSVVTCKAVGIGRGKTDDDPYVIYIWGNPKDNKTEGIYMSEDLGETWVRISDDLHSFGGTGNGQFVCGDMNVYGRCYMSTVGLGIAYFDKNDKS